MLLRKERILLFILMIFVLPVFSGNISLIAGDDDTLTVNTTQDETILYNLINDMRRLNKLPSIPLSPELCKVAQTHIADIIKWKPQEKGCSLHSWSGSGKWTACCNTKEFFGIQCMKSKPREIAGYQGDGYELIYWAEDKATPSEAADLWKQVAASSDMILGRAKWKGYQWKAMGVGIKEGFAILWLGDSIINNASKKPDNYTPVTKKPSSKEAGIAKAPEIRNDIVKPQNVVKQNEAATIEGINKPIVTTTGIRFYVIAGSFKTAEAANKGLNIIISQGYPHAIILEGESAYRIAVASFDTKVKADILKDSLQKTVPGIWVYKR